MKPSEMDLMLEEMLAPPLRASDRTFACEIDRAIDAHHAYARARRRFWQNFGVESLGIAALLAGLWILSSSALLAPFAGPAHWGLASPLLLVLLLWFAAVRRRDAFG